ncbi:hypothetical protein FGO68_gene8009 [Halteria grandinella]|uniref:Uncharacterized protein n=1 Tax=Halteria grandinella TaxID=5974 RepID=A0A8J8TA40_HALGN|nr:hypothetical protein FGO68_gene8009 [Halteria grandinella]
MRLTRQYLYLRVLGMSTRHRLHPGKSARHATKVTFIFRLLTLAISLPIGVGYWHISEIFTGIGLRWQGGCSCEHSS